MTERSYHEILKADQNIKTEFWAKPIPIRGNDWLAYYDGQEETGRYGYGSTEGEAIDDLVNNWPR